MSNAKLAEVVDLKVGVINADITTDRTGTYYDVSGASEIRAKLFTTTVAQTKVVTVELLQAQDSSGTGSKALVAAVTATAPTGGSVLSPEVECNVDALDAENGFTYVAVKVTSDNATAVIGCAALELYGLRYKPVA